MPSPSRNKQTPSNERNTSSSTENQPFTSYSDLANPWSLPPGSPTSTTPSSATAHSSGVHHSSPDSPSHRGRFLSEGGISRAIKQLNIFSNEDNDMPPTPPAFSMPAIEEAPASAPAEEPPTGLADASNAVVSYAPEAGKADTPAPGIDQTPDTETTATATPQPSAKSTRTWTYLGLLWMAIVWAGSKIADRGISVVSTSVFTRMMERFAR